MAMFEEKDKDTERRRDEHKINSKQNKCLGETLGGDTRRRH